MNKRRNRSSKKQNMRVIFSPTRTGVPRLGHLALVDRHARNQLGIIRLFAREELLLLLDGGLELDHVAARGRHLFGELGDGLRVWRAS
jgi:hypothetical protein